MIMKGKFYRTRKLKGKWKNASLVKMLGNYRTNKEISAAEMSMLRCISVDTLGDKIRKRISNKITVAPIEDKIKEDKLTGAICTTMQVNGRPKITWIKSIKCTGRRRIDN